MWYFYYNILVAIRYKIAEGRNMQIKKEEIKQRILDVSKQLFTNAGYDTADKIEEVSEVLARIMSQYREGILIMLKSVGSKDQVILTEMMKGFFVETCPIDDREFKVQIVSLIIMGLKDILIKYSEEDEIRYRLQMLISYHYLGLNGIKERFGYKYEG